MKYFGKVSEIFFYIHGYTKKSFLEIFLKPLRNVSLENVCEKNFGEAFKNLAVTFLKVLFHDVHTVSKFFENFAKIFQAMIQEMFLKGFLIIFREMSWQGFFILFYLFNSRDT